jgi:hypothetical protein
LIKAPATSTPSAASSSKALADVSVREVSTILENLSFSTLVEPFLKNGISGKSINRFESYKDIMELDNVNIKKIVAETFFVDYVQEWKSTGMVPKGLLQDISPTGFSLKVCMYVCMYHNYIGVYLLCRHGSIVALKIYILI